MTETLRLDKEKIIFRNLRWKKTSLNGGKKTSVPGLVWFIEAL